MTKLAKELSVLDTCHEETLRRRVAADATSPSVVRALAKGSNKKARTFLLTIELSDLEKITNQSAYWTWWRQHHRGLTRILKGWRPKPDKKEKEKKKEMKTNIQKVGAGGLEWGHAAKILNIYLRDLVTRYEVLGVTHGERIRDFLYLPIDTIVLKQLRQIGVTFPMKSGGSVAKIKDVSTEPCFNKIQDCLQEAAARVDSYRARFDDILLYVKPWPALDR